MSRAEIPINPTEVRLVKMTRGCAFLTKAEARLLRLRSKTRRISVSSTIEELVQPALVRLETADGKEREAILNSYLEQIIGRSRAGLNAFLDGQKPLFTEVYWVLPEPFVERIDNVASGRISRDSLMNGILSDAVNMRDVS